MAQSDRTLIRQLKTHPGRAMRSIYQAYYKEVCQQIYVMIRDRPATEDIAQEVFFQIWKKRDTLEIRSSLRGYLLRAARNRTLNYIRDELSKKTDDQEVHLHHQAAPDPSVQRLIEAGELGRYLNHQIDQLPARCRLIFTLSRSENMTYREIASELDISVKTVENQMTKALKILRAALKQYRNRG